MYIILIYIIYLLFMIKEMQFFDMRHKYRCPECGSTNLGWWEEQITEIHYKLRKDGKPYKKPYEHSLSGADGHEGIECLDCRNLANVLSDDFKEWENPEYEDQN